MKSLLPWIIIICGCVSPSQPITQPRLQLPEKADPEPEQEVAPEPKHSLEEVQQEIAALKFLQEKIAKQERELLEATADGDKYYSLLGEDTRTQLKAGKILLTYISSLKEDLKRRLVSLQEIEAKLQPQD